MEDFKIRAVTSFLTLKPDDFQSRRRIKKQKIESNLVEHSETTPLEKKISKYATFLKQTEEALKDKGYEVQTLRIATNPFGEYLHANHIEEQLSELNETLETFKIEFFSLGPATNATEVPLCPKIVSISHRLSCSADLSPDDFEMAKKAAECMQTISKLDGAPHVKNGLGNFQFCAAACCKPYTPFFPCARSQSYSAAVQDEDDVIHFALGLENGKLAKKLLGETKSIDKISTTFKMGMADALTPVSKICENIAKESKGTIQFEGIDTSLNPSLDLSGSVAAAIEQIDVVKKFGGRGSVAAAAEITKALKSLPGIKNAGYSGLMLPVCEDRRLAELELDTTRLLGISSVCGVGLDTIPVSGSASVAGLMGLILDVSSLAFRYEKSLSCRLLLCPGLKGGDKATFNSPYLCDSKIFDV
jgi:uncharacterized protein (UPF0210 family)